MMPETHDVTIEVAVNEARQLFNDRDPSPFKDHDLDENFVRFLLNSVQGFPFKTRTRLKITITDKSSGIQGPQINSAIHSFFTYEAGLVNARKRKSVREGRIYLLAGLIAMFSCLSFSQLLETSFAQSRITLIIQEGLVIIGWVAMWRPLEMFLYDWWPLHEQQLYMKKIAEMEKEII